MGINMLKEMIKVRVIGTKSCMPSIIEKMHELKIVHIIEKEAESGINKCPPLSADDIYSSNSIEHFVGYLRNSTELKQKLEKVTDRFLLKSHVLKNKELVALFVDK